MKKKWIYLTLLPLAYGCLENTDFNNFDDLEYRGEWAVPVVNASLKLTDILEEDSTFTFDPDGGIRIIYESDSIYGASVADFLSIPDQDPQEFSMVAGAPDINIEFEMATLAGAEIKNVTIKEGRLKWSLTNPDSNSVDLQLSVLNATLNNDTAHFNFSSTTMGVDTGTIDISGLDFDLASGSLGFNNLEYRMRVVNDGGSPSGTQYDVSVRLTDLVVQDAVGYFGERNISLPSGALNPDISGFKNLLKGLYLENPTIKLKVVGNVGIPIDVAPNLDGINGNGKVIGLQADPISYDGPVNQGNWDTTTYILDRNTSNIVDFIANIPESIVYAGELVVNPNGKGSSDNFINNNGKMYVGLELDLPLELRTDDMLLEQEIYDLDLGVSEEDADMVEKLVLHFKVTNGFPFDADLKMIFRDSTQTALDSVEVSLLTSATVDAQGKVTSPTISRSEIEFDPIKIDNLLKAKQITLRVLLNSYNNGQDIVKIYTDYNINIALGLETKLNIKP